MTEKYEDLGGLGGGKRVFKPRPVQPAGCQHTEDPAGWLMDRDGNIIGRCDCWYEIAETPETAREN